MPGGYEKPGDLLGSEGLLANLQKAVMERAPGGETHRPDTLLENRHSLPVCPHPNPFDHPNSLLQKRTYLRILTLDCRNNPRILK